MQHFTVKPVWARARNHDLAVDVARIVGYRLVCDDGSHGPTRNTVAEARRDKGELVNAAHVEREAVSPDVSAEA